VRSDDEGLPPRSFAQAREPVSCGHKVDRLRVDCVLPQARFSELEAVLIPRGHRAIDQFLGTSFSFGQAPTGVGASAAYQA
jgi:hypothetical protein